MFNRSLTALALFASGLCISQAVVWNDFSGSMTASITGGNPIGLTSDAWTSHVPNINDSSDHFPYHGAYLADFRSLITFSGQFITSTPQPIVSTDVSWSYDHQSIFGDDNSTHHFDMQIRTEVVFTLQYGGRIWGSTPGGTLADTWTAHEVQAGTYSAGVFTPTGTVFDLSTAPNVDVTSGTYRFVTDFSASFDSNTGFTKSTGLNVMLSEAVPEPMSMVALAAGVGLICRRRRRPDSN